MNVLLFVTSLLMVMALMTYARMDMYRYFTLTQVEFERYMRYIERDHNNQFAKNWYDTTKANTKASTPTPNDDNTPINPPQTPNDINQNQQPPAQTPNDTQGSINQSSSGSRLNIRTLIDPAARASNENTYAQVKQWTKNLMNVLYGEQRFFRVMLLTRPTFMDEIFDSLTQTIQTLPEDQRPKKANDLANIRLGNDLEETFYFMLKGCPTLELAAEPTLPPPPPPSEFFAHPEEVYQDDETDSAQEAQEYSTGKGYSSLLNYITLNKTGKVRVYLASRELLLAIFGQPEIVENIINTRHSLYLSVRSRSVQPEEATQQFQSQFQGSVREGDSSLLDFKVTKTNPSEYN